MSISVKRVYAKPSKSDGYRVLVDRIWPRGISKKKAKIDEWMKGIAPSTQLRKWFDHDPDKWEEFKKKYFQELESNPKQMSALREKAKNGRITLVFSAKDEEHNNALALEEFLNQMK